MSSVTPRTSPSILEKGTHGHVPIGEVPNLQSCNKNEAEFLNVTQVKIFENIIQRDFFF